MLQDLTGERLQGDLRASQQPGGLQSDMQISPRSRATRGRSPAPARQRIRQAGFGRCSDRFKGSQEWVHPPNPPPRPNQPSHPPPSLFLALCCATHTRTSPEFHKCVIRPLEERAERGGSSPRCGEGERRNPIGRRGPVGITLPAGEGGAVGSDRGQGAAAGAP